MSCLLGRMENHMVTRETCPTCRGDKWVKIRSPKTGAVEPRKCPDCNGVGFRVRVNGRRGA